MSEPTKADRDLAYKIEKFGDRNTIAYALAEERARALEPFRKLVAFYDRHEYASLNVDDLRELLAETEAER